MTDQSTEILKGRSLKLMTTIKKSIPEVRIRFKNKAGVYYILFLFVSLFNKRMMTDFTTVLGNTIWFPDKTFLEDDNRLFSILSHEFVHLMDKKKWGPIFTISYLFPQVLCVLSSLSLLSIWFSNYWMLSLLSLVFLFPFPSLPRRIWEIRGYTVSMVVDKVARGSVGMDLKHLVLKNMTGWEYYKTSWDKDRILEIISDSVAYVEDRNAKGRSVYIPYKVTKTIINSYLSD